MTERNRSQVVPFTLTEVLTLLFFVLALALTWEMHGRAEAEEALEDNRQLIAAAQPLGPSAQRELVRVLTRGRTEFPEDFKELARGLDAAGETREQLRSHLAATGSDSAFVDTASIDQLVDTAVARQARAERELQALTSSLGSGQADVVRNMAEETAQLRGTAADLRAQLAYYRNRVGNGLDHPPCWADPAGRPEYALRITLRDARLDVEPIWPEHRRRDAARVDGLLSAPGAGLTFPEFERRALPIFEWSRARDPECRHFVIIVDRVRAGKEMYKVGLLTVERFFYKYLAD